MSLAGKRFDVVVIGAGPAGLAVSCVASECGKRVLLIDDNPTAGGQIWRGNRDHDPMAATWLARVRGASIETAYGSPVIAADPHGHTITVETPGGSERLTYENLILATGARERFLPFPGWTLPNVMGAGGLQALVKSGLPIENKRVIVAGTGPLLLAVAAYLAKSGAQVLMIAEQAPRRKVLEFALSLSPGKLWQAARLQLSLTGVPYRTGTWVEAALGTGKLDAVRLRSLGKSITVPCDYLAIGYGLVPNLELPALLGCRTTETGVAVDDWQHTSVAAVLCAGEATGIGGVDKSIVEGKIAGYIAGGDQTKAAALFAARKQTRRFAARLEKAFRIRSDIKALPTPETLVCRCEDVSYARMRSMPDWRTAKLQTRCGMGACQGRICGPAAAFLFGWKFESVRPPIVPTSIAHLIQE
jgi:NADPH-dependent 2,4-dienoyl-CoA reductase/sulfur reductase-like enzyme